MPSAQSHARAVRPPARRVSSIPIEPAAVRAAARLRPLGPERALDKAEAVLARAIAAGNIARADLYVAVCVVLADQDRVFSLLRHGAAA